MKARTVLVPVLAGVLLAGTAGAGAATPTLDGKRVKALAATYHPAAQANDTNLATDGLPAPVGTDPDRFNCSGARCGRLTFLYAPARGVRGGLMFRTTWSSPTTDVDLYVVELDKYGEGSRIDSCGGSGGTSETVYVPAGELRAGHRYAIVNDWFRITPGETVKTSVAFPSRDTSATTIPAAADPLNLDCSL